VLRAGSVDSAIARSITFLRRQEADSRILFAALSVRRAISGELVHDFGEP
jgi:hypothetical protein